MTQLMEQKNPPRKMNTPQKRPQRTQRFTKNPHQHQHNRNNHGQGGGQSGRSLLAQRNTFQQNLERYLNLARDAKTSGDRVLAENYYQYAEHYFRSLNEVKAMIELETPKREAQPVQNEESRESSASLKDVAKDSSVTETSDTVSEEEKAASA